MIDFPHQPAPHEELIPPAPVFKRWSKADAGCIVDGARGLEAAYVMVTISMNCGWTPGEGDLEVIQAAQTNNVSEDQLDTWREIQEEAEQWLNDVIAPDGYWFGWVDGDFMLASEVMWCEWNFPGECDNAGHDHGSSIVV